MSEKAHITPAKLGEIISKLKAFETKLRSDVQANRRYVENLQQQWNDNQYNAFRANHNEFWNSMQKPLTQDLPVLIKDLQNLKQAAEQYLRTHQQSGRR